MTATPVVIVTVPQATPGHRGGRLRPAVSEALGERSVLAHTLHNVMASSLPMLVVTPPELAEEASRWVARRDVLVQEGGSSGPRSAHALARGVAARPDASGWLLLPADKPLVRPAVLQAVARALDEHAVAYAAHRGQRGHPLGFGSELFSELVRLDGDEGVRRLLVRYPAASVSVDDPGVLQSLDSEADLAGLRARWPEVAALSAHG
ncbi:nucleotidyltransferase family protein [Ideonella oryzae]|uniref:NTP transferase domain-containing protein n=1 Tax=Ideonella oryzae TaxID=2937441 RepID=A0ABT1BIC0_9BURK|nr:NTP transferase domain-containing protein [Ideonella oryzae]MCO5975955.1 NTP transferase domain-containing protein [Ideonella oryzae]